MKNFRKIFSLIIAMFAVAGAFAAFAGGAAMDVNSTTTGTGLAMAAAAGVDPLAIREVLRKCKAAYPSATITEHTLRTLTLVENSKNNFELKFHKGTDTPKAIERRLDENDVFIGVGIGMFLRAVTSSVFSTSRRQTYPNPEVFVTDSTNFINPHLNALYNGWITFKSGSVVNFEGIDTQQFMYVPEAQQGATTAAYTGTAFEIADSGYSAGAGYKQLTGFIVLRGNGSNTFELVINPDTTLKIANTNTNVSNYIECEMRGVLVKGLARDFNAAVLG
ncbi:MAG: hypothetical protein ACXWW0_00140 [Bacteroidia bacterium]